MTKDVTMKRIVTICCTLLLAAGLGAQPAGRVSFNDGWRFLRLADTASTLSPGIYADPSFDDSGWRKLTLPHDWGVEGPFEQAYPGETGKLKWWGKAWYRTSDRTQVITGAQASASGATIMALP